MVDVCHVEFTFPHNVHHRISRTRITPPPFDIVLATLGSLYELPRTLVADLLSSGGMRRLSFPTRVGNERSVACSRPPRADHVLLRGRRGDPSPQRGVHSSAVSTALLGCATGIAHSGAYQHARRPRPACCDARRQTQRRPRVGKFVLLGPVPFVCASPDADECFGSWVKLFG